MVSKQLVITNRSVGAQLGAKPKKHRSKFLLFIPLSHMTSIMGRMEASW